MTTLELKAQILKEIDNEQNTAILKKLQAYYRKLKGAEKPMPTRYTLDELHTQLDKAEEDIKNGRVTSHKELLNEITTW
ncbi:MAG: hypothetical protein LBS55_05700 [Prevotellaceae bacterium]|jgi:hypothetical protein|nr:hypothetical protein [Prevotellaceae bacterium]